REDIKLYLAETPGSFSKKKKEQPKLCLFTKPFEEHDFVLSEKMVWACPEQEVPPVTLHIVLLEVYNELLRWDCMFTEALVNHSDYRKLMSMGQNMLPWEYIISTWDLKCAYQTPRSNIPMDDSARQMMVE
ncbi:MAG: hypothetical protein LUD73_00335, partial [Lachnospiraceae bacterium]|nr:hypothetical protein [Lachnospiraceae bacterium]